MITDVTFWLKLFQILTTFPFTEAFNHSGVLLGSADCYLRGFCGFLLEDFIAVFESGGRSLR